MLMLIMFLLSPPGGKSTPPPDPSCSAKKTPKGLFESYGKSLETL
jgi:hypothetical protein